MLRLPIDRWCRCEYFIFALWAEMQAEVKAVDLYVLMVDGSIRQYPSVFSWNSLYRELPSGGDLAVETDRELIRRAKVTLVFSCS